MLKTIAGLWPYIWPSDREDLKRKLFNQIAEDLASEYSSQIKGMNMEERLEFIKELLAQEGFTVEWEKKGNDYQIHEISCPYYQIGIDNPEVCTVDQNLISKMLALPDN